MPKFMTIVWPSLSAALATVIVMTVMQANRGLVPESKQADHPIAASIEAGAHSAERVTHVTNDELVRQSSTSIKPADVTNHQSNITSIESTRPTELDNATYQQSLFAKSTEFLAAHDRESRDNIWASRLESQIQEQLSNAPENSKMKFERVDCRTRTCLVVISWPSSEEASEDVRLPARALSTVPCGIRPLPQSMPPTTGYYQATLYLDCSRA